MSELLKCKLCGKECKSLLRHVSGKHKEISLEEYKKLDPRDRYTADSTHKLLSEHESKLSKELWKSEEYHNKISSKNSEHLKRRWKEDKKFRLKFNLQ